MTDICCIGHITHDTIITPKTRVEMAGGTSVYFAHAIRQLPPAVSFRLITKVGSDALPEVERLRTAGVDVTCYPSEHTVYFENKYGTDANRRTQRVLAKADPFTIEELQDAEARIFHLGSLLNDDFSPETVRHLASRGRISIDVQGFLREVRRMEVYPTDWRNKEEVLGLTDILKLNEHEMTDISGLHDPRTVARQLAEYGVREVVITLGSYGSLIYAEGRFYEIPAYKPTAIIDTTGCGDTYSAGYLYCRSQGIGYEASGKFAAAMCTLKLEHNGPFDRTIEEIRRTII